MKLIFYATLLLVGLVNNSLTMSKEDIEETQTVLYKIYSADIRFYQDQIKTLNALFEKNLIKKEFYDEFVLYCEHKIIQIKKHMKDMKLDDRSTNEN